jgi:hypothetical protein
MTMNTATAVAIDHLAAKTRRTPARIKQVVAKEAPRLADRVHKQMSEERLVLTLSGGAPHSPLMAGALCALYETIGPELNRGKRRFDAIYTAGGGALVGLLLVAPKGGDAPTALRKMVKMGIADPIYKILPLAYKVFVKPGPFVPLFQEWAELFKRSTSHLPFFRAAVTTALKLWAGRPRRASPGGARSLAATIQIVGSSRTGSISCSPRSPPAPSRRGAPASARSPRTWKTSWTSRP